jgi:hypothetical protein
MGKLEDNMTVKRCSGVVSLQDFGHVHTLRIHCCKLLKDLDSLGANNKHVEIECVNEDQYELLSAKYEHLEKQIPHFTIF